MYPAIEPFATGHLPVSDGNEIYWETSGNPHGMPALFLHGGPGSGCQSGYRRRFDPERFLIVGFDQRGCGRSRPRVIDAAGRLTHQTLPALIDDIEKLRTHLGVENWLLHGVSWGTALGLAYAQACPARARALVLTAIHLPSRAEVEWMTEGVGRHFPREWESFLESAHAKPGERLIDAYYRRIIHPNPDIRNGAARAWCAWENAHVSLDPKLTPDPRFEDAEFRMIFATLTIHYWKHAAEPTVLTNMRHIAHIPGVVIHGRLDVSSPLGTAFRLHQAWGASELIVIADEGHGGQVMFEETARAISRFASTGTGPGSVGLTRKNGPRQAEDGRGEAMPSR